MAFFKLAAGACGASKNPSVFVFLPVNCFECQNKNKKNPNLCSTILLIISNEL